MFNKKVSKLTNQDALEWVKELKTLSAHEQKCIDLISKSLVNEQNIEQIKEKLLEKFKEHCYPVTQKDNSIEEGMTLTGITQVLNEVFSNIESLDNERME